MAEPLSVPQESREDRVKRLARERMRAKRADGSYTPDLVRSRATTELIRRHRAEFERLLLEFRAKLERAGRKRS